MFLGINMFWACLRAHFKHRLAAESESEPKHIYGSELKLYLPTEIRFPIGGERVVGQNKNLYFGLARDQVVLETAASL